MTQKTPILGITMGDPCGIGPETLVKAVAREAVTSICQPLLIGVARVIEDAVALTGSHLSVRPVKSATEARFETGTVNVYEPKGCHFHSRVYGQVSAEAGHAAFLAITAAIELAQAGSIQAVVTGPIHKEAIHAAGHAFVGHTEIFAHYTGTKDYAMLLIYGDLRVIHVTTHIPLRQVCGSISQARVLKVIELADEACRKIGIPSPRIGVAGLNPHAGDGGLFGDEEARHIAPAIAAARSVGIAVEGPVPPDTLFPKARGGCYDICVAMYHDQGHIPLKLMGFHWDQVNRRWESVNGVNITLGLPIIRTSVDHGTAFDIAGQGIASADSMVHAIQHAVKLARAEAP